MFPNGLASASCGGDSDHADDDGSVVTVWSPFYVAAEMAVGIGYRSYVEWLVETVVCTVVPSNDRWVASCGSRRGWFAEDGGLLVSRLGICLVC